MVIYVHINKTKTVCIPTEEEWRQATSDDYDIKYINYILPGMEGKPVGAK